MSVHVPGVGFVEIEESIEACISYLKSGPDPEKRVACALWLGMCGDARAFVPLEEALVSDHGSVLVEGAFVDSYADAKQFYREALAELEKRVERDPRDLERSRALAAQRAAPVPVPTLRTDDEDARLAALAGDPTYIHHDAMKLYSSALSVRMRRAIADHWIRYRQRMGGSVDANEVLRFLTDADPEVRRMIAAHVVESDARVHPTNDRAALHELAREVLGKPPKPFSIAEYAAGHAVRRASALEEAMREAHASGKEPFDWPAFLASGCRPHGEEEHREDYYVSKREMRTMAEYIAFRKEMDPWD